MVSSKLWGRSKSFSISSSTFVNVDALLTNISQLDSADIREESQRVQKVSTQGTWTDLSRWVQVSWCLHRHFQSLTAPVFQKTTIVPVPKTKALCDNSHPEHSPPPSQRQLELNYVTVSNQFNNLGQLASELTQGVIVNNNMFPAAQRVSHQPTSYCPCRQSLWHQASRTGVGHWQANLSGM